MVPSLDREFYKALKFLIILYMQYREVANFSFFPSICRNDSLYLIQDADESDVAVTAKSILSL